MRIFIAHATGFPEKAAFYKALRNSELNTSHELILPEEDIELQPHSRGDIHNYNLVIAEVSSPSHGVGIELAWAEAANVPVVCVYKKGAEFSGSLHSVCNKFMMYTDFDNMISDITRALEQYE